MFFRNEKGVTRCSWVNVKEGDGRIIFINDL